MLGRAGRPRLYGDQWWWTTGQHPWVKFVELFLVANAVAAVLSLGLAPGSEDWFTWTIVPDASARLLAVMYANAVVLGVVALRQPDWARARAIFVLITVFAVAATTMTFFQLDPFLAHPWYHLTYWLSGYAVLVATAPAVLRVAGAHARRPAAGRPADDARAARDRRRRGAGDGRRGAPLLVDPGAFSATLAVADRAADRAPARRLARGLRRRLRLGAVGRRLAAARGRSTSPRRSPGLLLALVPPLHAGGDRDRRAARRLLRLPPARSRCPGSACCRRARRRRGTAQPRGR